MEIGTLLSQESEDSAAKSPMHVYKKNFKKSDRLSRFKNSRTRVDTVGSQMDQTLINEWILTIKRLTTIEKSSASAVRPTAKKVAVSRGSASSSLNEIFTEGDSVKKIPE